MTEAIVIAKIIFLITGMQVTSHAEGIGAYYQPGLMEQVCRHRVDQGWSPGLDCDHPCLVAGIEHDTLGDWVLIDVPGASYHYCQVVDVGSADDLPALRARGEVIEVPYWLAMEAGWDGYQPNVRIWWIGGEDGRERD